MPSRAGPSARAPSDYIESHFDGFAATFDRKLVGDLLYDVPRTLAGLVATVGRTFRDILDLGCGTGLAAAALAPFDGRLTGVDLSGGMLEQAAKRGHYAELVKAEAVAFMVDHPAGFDLVFAADVVNYFGDLEPVFAGAARALRPGGLFAFSIETMAGDGHRLQPSGRFTHATSYVERAASGFSVLAQQATTIRIEAGRPRGGPPAGPAARGAAGRVSRHRGGRLTRSRPAPPAARTARDRRRPAAAGAPRGCRPRRSGPGRRPGCDRAPAPSTGGAR